MFWARRQTKPATRQSSGSGKVSTQLHSQYVWPSKRPMSNDSFFFISLALLTPAEGTLRSDCDMLVICVGFCVMQLFLKFRFRNWGILYLLSNFIVIYTNYLIYDTPSSSVIAIFSLVSDFLLIFFSPAIF